MSKIKTIEKEYEEFKSVSEFVTSLDKFALFIEKGLDNIEEELKVILEEIKINCKYERRAKLSNLFFGFIRIKDSEFYQEDNKILEELIDLILKYKESFQRLSNTATENNYQELTKLVDFACLYYNKHIDYFECKRDILEYANKGISYFDNKENNISEFNEFFDYKIQQFENDKAVEKKKNMC